VERVTIAVLNLLVARRWEVGAESRWTHTMRTLAKVMFGFLLHGALPESLQSLRRFWGVSPDLEAQLAAVLADQEGHEHNRHLRLLRICRALCAPQSAWQLAVLATALRPIDDCMYFILGEGRPVRPTLLDLLSLETPRFANTMQSLSGLLRDFGPTSLPWVVLRVAGGDFKDPACRKFARCFVLQLVASFLDHFVLKWSEPPYSLLPLLEPTVAAAEKRRRAASFFAKPAHCLSLFLRRLRARYPSVPALMSGGLSVLRSWNDGQCLGIDYCEKSHYALRLQLRSAGRAKNATHAANTVFVREAIAGHAKLHGRLPAQSLAETASFRAAVPQPPLPAAAPAKPSHMGHAQLVALNSKMHAFKRLHAPDRSLTPEERAKAQAQAKKEWSEQRPEVRDQWLRLHEAASLAKRHPLPLPPSTPAPPPATNNLWGSPADPASLVPAAAIVNTYEQAKSAERKLLCWSDPRLLVGEDVPARMASQAAGVDDDSPDFDLSCKMGCCWDGKKNVCRASLPPGDARRMDGLTELLNRWCAVAGPAADDASALALLRGSGAAVGEGPEQEVDIIVLCALRRKRPAMQVFARCSLGGAAGPAVFACPPAPFQVTARSCPSRLCAACDCVELCTSDELALELARLRHDWILIPLVWSEPCDVESLLVFDVTALEQPLPAKAPRRHTPQGARDLLSTLASLGSAPLQPPAEHGENTHEQSGSEDEDRPMAGFPADFAGDVAAELAEECGLFEAAVADLDEALNPVSADAGAESDAEAEAIALEEPVAVAAGIDGQAAAAVPAAEAAVVDEGGWVSCPVEPWCRLGSVGRITTWPATKAMKDRSVSVKCFAHLGCSSPARKRAAVTDAALLEWLFAGTCEPFCPRGRSEDLAREHKALWATVIDARRVVAVPSASSGSSFAGPS
jgi:hypothetical protein